MFPLREERRANRKATKSHGRLGIKKGNNAVTIAINDNKVNYLLSTSTAAASI